MSISPTSNGIKRFWTLLIQIVTLNLLKSENVSHKDFIFSQLLKSENLTIDKLC